MKFNLVVTQTDVYSKVFEVEAESLEEAIASVENELEECPLDTQSNTLDSSEQNIEELVG